MAQQVKEKNPNGDHGPMPPHTPPPRMTPSICLAFQSTSTELSTNRITITEQNPVSPLVGDGGVKKTELNPEDSVGEEEEWETEAHKLYEWTQELSLDELVATPRLSAMSLATSH